MAATSVAVRAPITGRCSPGAYLLRRRGEPQFLVRCASACPSTPRLSGLAGTEAGGTAAHGRACSVMSILLGVDPATDPGIETAAAPSPRVGVAAASVGVSVPAKVGLQRRDRRPAGRRGRLDRAPHRHPLAPHRRAPTSASTTMPTRGGAAALVRAGIDPLDVDLVIVATTTADEVMPERRAAGRPRAGRHPRRRVRRRLGLHRLSLGAGRRRRLRSRPGAPAASWSSAPTSCRGSPTPTTGRPPPCLPTARARSCWRRPKHAGRIGPMVLGADGAGADHIRVDAPRRR